MLSLNFRKILKINTDKILELETCHNNATHQNIKL